MKKRNIFAALVMVLLILGSLVFGSYRSARKLRDQHLRDYYRDGDGNSISAQLNVRLDEAQNLTKLAVKYQEAHPELSPLVDEVLAAVEAGHTIHNVGEQTAHNDAALETSMSALADAFEQLPLTQTDRQAVNGIRVDFRSAGQKIAHSSYNGDAQEFNDRLTRFPLNVMERLGILEPLPIFD